MSNISLNKIIDSIPESKLEHVDIDVSGFFGLEEGEFVITLKEPSIKDFEDSHKDALKSSNFFKNKSKRISSEMAALLTLIARCHVKPEIEDDVPVGELYYRLFEKSERLYLFVIGKFTAAFPWLVNLDSVVEEKKEI